MFLSFARFSLTISLKRETDVNVIFFFEDSVGIRPHYLNNKRE